MKMLRLMFVIVLTLCCASCQDLEFWTSLPLSATDSTLAYNMKSFAFGVQIAFRVANSNPQYGSLQNHNVSLRILDDKGNQSLFQSNIQSIINNPNLLGLVLSSSTSNAIDIHSQLNDSIPFINPASGHSSLRTSTSRNIINFRPSNQAEVYGMLSALRNGYSIQRLAFFYELGDADSEEALVSIHYYISVLGLSLSSFAGANSSTQALEEAADEISIGNPSAVIIWASSQNVVFSFMKLLGGRLPATTVYVINYSTFLQAVNFTLDAQYNLILTLPPPITSVLANLFLPMLQSQLALQYQMHYQLYGNNEVPLGSSFIYEGYLIGRVITQALVRINKYPITQEDLLQQLYKTPLFKINDFLLGPLSDDDSSQTAVFPVCNELTHSLQLINCTNGLAVIHGIQVVPGSSVSWRQCTPRNNSLLPINFGTVFDPDDVFTTGGILGIEAAFAALNKDSRRQGLNPLQLIKLPITKDSNFLDSTRTLLRAYDITALVGYSEAAALAVQDDLESLQMPLVDILSGSSVFRANPYIINIRTGIKEQVLGMLYYLLSKPGVKNKQMNVGIYYQNDLSGREYMRWINQVLAGFKSYTDNNQTIPVPPPFVQMPGGYNTLNFVFTFSSDQLQWTQSNLNTIFKNYPVIDCLLVNSREDSLFLIQMVSAINAAQPQATPVPGRSSDGTKIINYNHLQVFYSSTDAIMNLTLTAENMNVTNLLWISTYYSGTTLPGGANALELYMGDTGVSGYTDDKFLQYGFGGWIAAQMLAFIVADINGIVNSTSLLSSLYSTSSYNSGGVILGPYSLPSNDSAGCNAGNHNTLILRTLMKTNTSVDFSSIFLWTNCSASIPSFNTTSYVTDNHDNSRTTVIAVSVAVSVWSMIAVCLCLIIAVVLVLILYVFNPKQQKKRRVKPPRYEIYATKSIFYDRPTINVMFITSLSNSNASLKKNVLYQLKQLIFVPQNAYTILQALAKAGLARDDVSSAIMYIYFAKGDARDILNYGIQKEIAQATEESTLFREDSILAALWQAYIRLVGLPYLFGVCGETLYDIGQVAGRDKKQRGRAAVEDRSLFIATSYEVDKNRLEVGDDHFANMLHLKLAAQSLFQQVLNFPLPPELKWFLLNIRKETHKKFSDLTNGVLANFMFLRFICLGITTPNAFGLYKKQPPIEMLRFLVLLSKVIQNLAFGVEFEKEGYMTEMNDFIVGNRDAMNHWLEKISSGLEDSLLEESSGGSNKEVVASEWMKDSCLKWMYCQMHGHRHVLKRECVKRMEKEEWGDLMEKLEAIGVLNVEESSDSARTKSGNMKDSLGDNNSRSESTEDMIFENPINTNGQQ
eukprot:TRINITY_DN1904_c0_g1_i1.p1 TRINITY_DN1904_c0_g1~~TRINITY_DN1904_c0_g1_i1.p1  ORF type:complete len:1327 (+),score=209.24 TRINITY_DN1904_c0_g1_i1:215-4195(+)